MCVLDFNRIYANYPGQGQIAAVQLVFFTLQDILMRHWKNNVLHLNEQNRTLTVICSREVIECSLLVEDFKMQSHTS